jgi:hypothetical protein
MKEFTLKLDIDRARRTPRWQLDRLAKIVHLEIVRVVDERSPGGKGWHSWITVRALDEKARWRPTEIVALQLLMGSDVWREAYTLHRARLVEAQAVALYWRDKWNVFYSTSAKGKRRSA